MDLLAVFDIYERRFAKVMSLIPERNPANPAHKDEIRAIVRNLLGIQQDWLPRISAQVVGTSVHQGFSIEYMQGQSWPNAKLAAHLYLPEKSSGNDALPLVLLCCGHGPGCKLSPGYQAMARHLARCGAAVLVPDNVGQGERTPMGHRDPIAPFFCGTTIQGLIVMEHLAWLSWVRQNSRFDTDRLAAVGNSGGGHATCFLATLDHGLAAVSSSGRPGTFEYTARKERALCGCAILPGIVGELEMWQLYGCFAPMSMFLFQGKEDSIFPWDLFNHTARKVRAVYHALGAEQRLRTETPPGSHSWDAARRTLLGDFICASLSLGNPAEMIDSQSDDLLNEENGNCYDLWPAEAIDTDQLAQQITGVKAPDGLTLEDVFPLRVDLPKQPDTILHNDTPQNARRIMAQFEAFLKK